MKLINTIKELLSPKPKIEDYFINNIAPKKSKHHHGECLESCGFGLLLQWLWSNQELYLDSKTTKF